MPYLRWLRYIIARLTATLPRHYGYVSSWTRPCDLTHLLCNCRTRVEKRRLSRSFVIRLHSTGNAEKASQNRYIQSHRYRLHRMSSKEAVHVRILQPIKDAKTLSWFRDEKRQVLEPEAGAATSGTPMSVGPLIFSTWRLAHISTYLTQHMPCLDSMEQRLDVLSCFQAKRGPVCHHRKGGFGGREPVWSTRNVRSICADNSGLPARPSQHPTCSTFLRPGLAHKD